jgi:hypothetical protein
MKITDRPTQRTRLRNRAPGKPLPPTERGLRFYHLLALAEEGKATAIADLFREFGFRFGEDQP